MGLNVQYRKCVRCLDFAVRIRTTKIFQISGITKKASLLNPCVHFRFERRHCLINKHGSPVACFLLSAATIIYPLLLKVPRSFHLILTQRGGTKSEGVVCSISDVFYLELGSSLRTPPTTISESFGAVSLLTES